MMQNAVIALLMVWPALAIGDPVTPDDIARMNVYVDAKGRVITHRPRYQQQGKLYWHRAHFGDKKEVYELVTTNIDSDVDHISVWDPRVNARLFTKPKGDTMIVQCNDKDVATFTQLSPADAKELLASVTFKPPLWTRTTYLFARDDSTTYVFVDHPRVPKDNSDYRIYVGKRGAMKEQKILDMTSDEVGDVLITPAGTLRTTVKIERYERLIQGATWARAKSKTKEPLIFVPLSSKLIHGDLGVYTGQRLGSPCD